MTTEQKAERFRLAAEDIFNDKNGCTCLSLWLHGVKAEMIIKYSQLFCPVRDANRGFWLSVVKWECYSEIKRWRIWALCLAAAMAETGDL